MATPNALARLAELGIGGLPAARRRHATSIAPPAPGAVHQGIVVIADPLPETDLADLADARLVVVLDQVTDPHNVGAILRSAAAFGADALVLRSATARRNPACWPRPRRAGWSMSPLVRVKNLARALDQLGDMGFLRLGLDSGHAEPIEAARRRETRSRSCSARKERDCGG